MCTWMEQIRDFKDCRGLRKIERYSEKELQGSETAITLWFVKSWCRNRELAPCLSAKNTFGSAGFLCQSIIGRYTMIICNNLWEK
jgi:hypothetical protein